MALWQESSTKGTLLNRHIRKYFGLRYVNDYVSTNPLNLIGLTENQVDECDYKTMSTKDFYKYYVSQNRPCLFKNYAKIWPAYGKWNNETYLKERAGQDVIYAEK